MKKNILIIGGTSGVGFELASHYVSDGHNVCATGRSATVPDGAKYVKFAITESQQDLVADIDTLVANFENVNTLVYSAGYLQRGHIDTHSDSALQQMVNLGLLAPMLLIQRLKNRLQTPLKIMLITSSSQYTAREMEPAYCAVKSGLGMLGASLVRDRAIGKVLVAAPSGIASPFWKGSSEDTSSMLDTAWVSQQIVDLSSGSFKYKFAKILRDPPRVDIVETLDNELRPIDQGPV